MATVKLQGNLSGSGSVTLVAPNTNSTRTITLPDADVTLGAGAGSIQAWAVVDGTGAVAIRDSGNVSSLTDQGTGRYQLNYSSSLAGSLYATVTGADRSDQAGTTRVALCSERGTPTTSYVQILTQSHTASLSDVDPVSVGILR